MRKCDTDLSKISILLPATRYDTIRYDTIRYIDIESIFSIHRSSTIPKPFGSGHQFFFLCRGIPGVGGRRQWNSKF